jgi:predicted phosphodiesterase
MNALTINNNPIYFWGDIHGNWRKTEFVQHIIRLHNLGESNIIQVGDFGIGFQEENIDAANLEILNELLISKNIYLYVIRGNHDNPEYFNGKRDLSNILFLPDYTVLSSESTNILCVGGAVSIDRTTSKKAIYRTGRHHWWPDEIFVYDEKKLVPILDTYRIDVVATHSAPTVFYPYSFNNIVFEYAAVDQLLIQDLIAERKRIDMLYDKILEKNTVKHWIYGHFHNSVTEYHGDMKALLLDISEIYHYN